MGTSIWLEVIFILSLIVLNGVFALSELALISARKTRLEAMVTAGTQPAKVALKLAQAPDEFLSTIQIGITFIGILAGAFGGATTADVLARSLKQFPALTLYAELISVSFVVFIITYLSLIIGELVPKRIALSNPEKIACIVAPAIDWLSQIAHPLVKLLSYSTNLFFRIFPIPMTAQPTITEAEIKHFLEQGKQAGTFQDFEQDAIERIFRLADRQVAVLMTPRSEIVWLRLDETVAQAKQKIIQHKYSFYPVAEGNMDTLLGVISSQDLLALALEERHFSLREYCRPPLFISEFTPAVKVIELFKIHQPGIAFVVDEYGGIMGLVTLQAIFSSVFSDGEDITDGNSDVVEREDGSWLIAGSMPFDDFMDHLDLNLTEQDERIRITTVGGFVMAQLGSIPCEGNHFVWKNWRFEVVDMDGRRVDKVLVSRLSTAADP